MEKMPYRPDLEADPADGAPGGADTTIHWRRQLPALSGTLATLRDLQVSDAPSLLTMLATEEVARFISPPPTTVDGFERFIAWTHRQRAAGQYVCFAVMARSTDTAIGLLAAGRVPDALVTHRIPLERTPEAFETLAGYADGVGKVIIEIAS